MFLKTQGGENIHHKKAFNEVEHVLDYLLLTDLKVLSVSHEDIFFLALG